MAAMKKRPSVRGKKVAIGRAVDSADDFVVVIRSYEEGSDPQDDQVVRIEVDEEAVSERPQGDSESAAESVSDDQGDGAASQGHDDKPDAVPAASDVEDAALNPFTDASADESSHESDAASFSVPVFSFAKSRAAARKKEEEAVRARAHAEQEEPSDVASEDAPENEEAHDAPVSNVVGGEAGAPRREDASGSDAREEASSARIAPGVPKAVEELAAIESAGHDGLARLERQEGFLAPDLSAAPAETFDLGDFGSGSSLPRASSSSASSSVKGAALRGSSSGALSSEGAADGSSEEKKAFDPGSVSRQASRWLRDKTNSLRPSSKQKTMDDVRPESQKASDFSADEARARGARQKAERKARYRRAALVGSLALLCVSLAFSGLVFWDFYFRYDDAADLQGVWQVSDGSMTVVIDEDSIRMPESLEYDYTIDTWAKTVSFTFMDLSGEGSYHFSDDRQVLIIREGKGDTEAKLSLVKVSDDVTAEPSFTSDQAVEDGASEGEAFAEAAALDEGA